MSLKQGLFWRNFMNPKGVLLAPADARSTAPDGSNHYLHDDNFTVAAAYIDTLFCDYYIIIHAYIILP